MSIGNLSPTVFRSYAVNDNWFVQNGGGLKNGNDPKSHLDNDGYDSNGYKPEDQGSVDRAGYSAQQYKIDQSYGGTLFDDIDTKWSWTNILDRNWPLTPEQEDAQIQAEYAALFRNSEADEKLPPEVRTQLVAIMNNGVWVKEDIQRQLMPLLAKAYLLGKNPKLVPAPRIRYVSDVPPPSREPLVSQPKITDEAELSKFPFSRGLFHRRKQS